MAKAADFNCGMNDQAAVLLRALASIEVDLPSGSWISTYPYCNCREMGFVLSIVSANAKRAPENIAFYEHRNSDEICAIRWTGRLPINGAVSPSDIPDGVFPDKWSYTESWPWLDIASAVNYALEVIREVAPDTEAAA